MTYHRTAGKNGTRNSPTERHADEYLPNFNKSTTAGYSRPPRQGRKQNNPTWADRYKAETGDSRPTDADVAAYKKRKSRAQGAKTKSRYDRMRKGIPPRKTLGEAFGSRLIGKSKVTGRY